MGGVDLQEAGSGIQYGVYGKSHYQQFSSPLALPAAHGHHAVGAETHGSSHSQGALEISSPPSVKVATHVV